MFFIHISLPSYSTWYCRYQLSMNLNWQFSIAARKNWVNYWQLNKQWFWSCWCFLVLHLRFSAGPENCFFFPSNNHSAITFVIILKQGESPPPMTGTLKSFCLPNVMLFGKRRRYINWLGQATVFKNNYPYWK